MAKQVSRQDIDYDGADHKSVQDEVSPGGKTQRLDITMRHYLALIDRLACQNSASSPHHAPTNHKTDALADNNHALRTLSHWVR